MRYPRDYNTVPRHLFWLFHLRRFFPWSAYLPGVARLSCRGADRAGRMRVLALCWVGFVMRFFTLSTTQEYYSMPIYPALALLLGCSMARVENKGNRVGAAVVAALRQQDFEAYTLSLGHLGDLTLQSFAYLRAPLVHRLQKLSRRLS